MVVFSRGEWDAHAIQMRSSVAIHGSILPSAAGVRKDLQSTVGSFSLHPHGGPSSFAWASRPVRREGGKNSFQLGGGGLLQNAWKTLFRNYRRGVEDGRLLAPSRPLQRVAIMFVSFTRMELRWGPLTVALALADVGRDFFDGTSPGDGNPAQCRKIKTSALWQSIGQWTSGL